jgi:chaperonin GroEL
MNNEPKDRLKEVTFNDEAHTHIHTGVNIMQKAVGSTYGPGGRNVLIQKKYVHPILTKDGVTVARDIAGHGHKLAHDVIAREAAKIVYQASEKTNKTAGDGTTATVLLLAELYKHGYRRTTAGDDPMVIKRLIDQNLEQVVQFIESKSETCNQAMLRQVGEISSGDPALGQMIADLVWDVGHDGAITISYHNAPHVEVEKVTGYLFNQGFRHLSQEVELDEPLVFVTQKRLASRTDIIPLLELMSQAKKQFIIVGDVSGAALDTLVGAISQQLVDGVPLPPPAYGADGHEYFEDIAIYTGARLWLEADSFKDLTLEDMGTVKRARLSQQKAILFGDNETGDAIAERIKRIKDQLQDTNVSPSLAETLEERYAKLAGKVSIIKVGANTEMGRERLFFQVEDAVEACKSALSSGVVAGGATTLLFASQLKGLEPFVKEALQQPFRLLLANVGEDGGYYLQKVLAAGYGKGYDLSHMDKEPIDLSKQGIVDPTKVILQTVKNAFENAGGLLTVGATVTEVDDNEVTSAA